MASRRTPRNPLATESRVGNHRLAAARRLVPLASRLRRRDPLREGKSWSFTEGNKGNQAVVKSDHRNFNWRRRERRPTVRILFSMRDTLARLFLRFLL